MDIPSSIEGLSFSAFVNKGGDRWFAFAKTDGGFLVAELLKGADPRVGVLEFGALSKKMAALLKTGYRRLEGVVYFDPVNKVITATSPDFQGGDGLWLLAAEVPDVAAATALVAERLNPASGKTVSGLDLQAWASRQALNRKTILAFRDYPEFGLVLAELAMQHGWLLMTSPGMGPVPSGLPSTQIVAWDDWLGKAFDRTRVAAARAALSMDLTSLFAAPVDVVEDPESNTVFI